MALTLYGVGDIRASRTHCERLLRMDPSNNKALALHDCIKDVAAKGTEQCVPSAKWVHLLTGCIGSIDNALGVGLIGAMVVAGIVLKFFLKR